MKYFLKKHRLLHIWAALLAALFLLYGWAISTPGRANAFTAWSQGVKDGYAGFYYLFPFSVVEWFYAAFILGCVIWVAVLCHRLRTGPEKLHTLYGGLLGLICLCLTAWGWYCLFWGVNYYADGFQEKSGVHAQPVEVHELQRVTEDFVDLLCELEGQVARDGSGVFAVPRKDIFAASTGIYANISAEFPFLARTDRVPKKMFFSRLFSAMNFTGFYTPFTGESNLNVDSPACLLPVNIAHELAHQRGIASEQECNFLAIAASLASDDPAYRYSGALMGYIHLGNALYQADREAWRQLRDRVPETVLADLRYHSAYWDQFEGLTAKVSKKVYDSTLKGYGQTDGIQSYGTVVDLLVVYY